MWPVRADREHLGQVLLNLSVNGRDAMPAGGNLIIRTENIEDGERLRRAGLEGDRWVALSVEDTGCGMTEATALHMFEPFYSTKDGGSGLGLPTTRKIIEAHGARIDVQSELNRGTQFTIEFPVPVRLPGEAAPRVEATSSDCR